MEAFQKIQLELPIIKNLTIHNMSRISSIIQDFFNNHTTNKAYTVLSLTQPGVIERVLNLSIETPQEQFLQQSDRPRPLVWDYVPLSHNRLTGKTNYYVCGMSRENLFQYQLLAIKAHINCIGIIPQRIALYTASKYFFPEAKEPSSIANNA